MGSSSVGSSSAYGSRNCVLSNCERSSTSSGSSSSSSFGYDSSSSVNSCEYSSSCGNGSDQPYKAMIKKTNYKPLVESAVNIEIRLNCKEMHWFLLAKLEKSSLEWISFEITTTNMMNLVRIMSNNLTSEQIEGSEFVGIYKGSFMQLCDEADSVVEKMQSYHLLLRNCRDFCNDLLAKLSLESNCPTTVSTIIKKLSKLLTTETSTTEQYGVIPLDPVRLEEVHQTMFSRHGDAISAAFIASMLSAQRNGKE